MGEQCEWRLLGVHHENNETFLMIREEDNLGIKIKKILKGQTSWYRFSLLLKQFIYAYQFMFHIYNPS